MLKDKINEDIKSAMKSGDKIKLETLRSIRAAIIEFDKSGLNKEMGTDDELKIINSQVKKRKDAIEIYEKANRFELAEKEKIELNVLLEFLPKQLSNEEIIVALKKIIAETNSVSINDLGKIMAIAMKELKGKADGKIVQETVKQLLG